MDVRLPYGRSYVRAAIPDGFDIDVIAPVKVDRGEAEARPDPATVQAMVRSALMEPAGNVQPFLASLPIAKTVAIAINDKTRPVPLDILLPPLLEYLHDKGIDHQAITFYIATGTHPAMPPDESALILPEAIYSRYTVVSHNSLDTGSLVHLGVTQRGTPVWVNKFYASADLRLVLGDIEPHQFAGFSGGVKTAAIGLAGPLTINHNHAMMMHPDARLGDYETNPVRQDIEEMGELIGVNFALNAVLDQTKRIMHVLAGEPRAVMQVGVPLARQVCQVPVTGLYDLIIASPGGHPKDINLYQGQKALGHAALVMRPGGTVIVVAACPEGTGSIHYEKWVTQRHSFQQVFNDFKAEGFRIGPHKAFQIARDASKVRLLFYSDMAPEFVRQLLMTPVESLQKALEIALADLPGNPRIGIMPNAASTIPFIVQSDSG